MNKIKINISREYRAFLFIFIIYLVGGTISGWIDVVISLTAVLYLCVKNDYDTLRYFTCMLVCQSFIVLICANNFTSTSATLFILSKEILIYACTAVNLIRNRKMKMVSLVFAAYLVIMVFEFMLSSAGVYARVLSIRQLLLPMICLYFGMGVSVSDRELKKIAKFLVSACVIIGFFGLVERFVIGDQFWKSLPISRYAQVRGTTFTYYNGVPLNFYTWDYVDFGLGVIRRLVSIFVDPLVTAHFLFFGFILCDYCLDNFKTREVTKAFLLVCCILTLSKGVFILIAVYYITRLIKNASYASFRRLLFVGICALGLLIPVMNLLTNLIPTSSIVVHFNGLLSGISNASLFGNGLGTAGTVTSKLVGMSAEERLAGESYLGTLLAQMGYFGVVLFYGFFIAVILFVERRFDRGNDKLTFNLIISVIAILLESILSESSIGIVGTGLYFVFLGIKYSEYYIVSEQHLRVKS